MRRKRGFTIIELLVVVAIVGILAAIGISNYYNAVQRARQKRTMSDIRTIAMAWESRAIDTKAYNAAAAGFIMPAVTITYGEAATLLAPTYLRTLPRFDAWGYPLDFAMNQPVGGAPATEYAIRSPGRDAAFTAGPYTPGPTRNFDCDIVFSGGTFVAWPDGVQDR